MVQAVSRLLARDAEDMRGSNTYLIPNINQHQGITKAHGRFNGTELPLYLNKAAAIEPLQPTLPEYVMKRLSRRGILYNNNLKTLQQMEREAEQARTPQSLPSSSNAP